MCIFKICKHIDENDDDIFYELLNTHDPNIDNYDYHLINDDKNYNLYIKEKNKVGVPNKDIMIDSSIINENPSKYKQDESLINNFLKKNIKL